jgi:hypothetical protein
MMVAGFSPARLAGAYLQERIALLDFERIGSVVCQPLRSFSLSPAFRRSLKFRL